MTPRQRATLAACALGLATLALYTGAAARSALALIIGAALAGAGTALLFRTPEDDQ